MQRRDFLGLALPSLGILPFLPTSLPGLLPGRVATEGFVVRAGQSRFGVPMPFRGINPNDLKVSARDTAGGLAQFDYVGVETTGPALHLHLAQDEIFYVVAGEYLFQLGTQKRILRPGDTIFLPRRMPHAWVQRSAHGQLLYWLQPAGQLEDFFLYMSQQKPPLPAAEMATRFGLQDVGPPLSPTEDYLLSDTLDAGFVVAAGAGRLGEHTRLGGLNPNDLKVAGRDTGGAFSLFEYTGRERGGPPLHVHPQQDEIFYILSGTYRFRVGRTEHELYAGDLIFLPHNVPHTFAQLTNEGRVLFSFQPTGRMEDFFRAAAAPQPSPGIFPDHGLRVVGPPLVLRSCLS